MLSDVDRLREEVIALRRAVDGLSAHVTSMMQSWPALMRDVGTQGSQRKEHERRLIRLEGLAERTATGGSTPPMGFSPISIGNHRLNPTESGLHYVDENMVSGARRLVSADVLEKTYSAVVKAHDEAAELSTWRWIKRHSDKALSSALSLAVGGGLVYLWHVLTAAH